MACSSVWLLAPAGVTSTHLDSLGAAAALLGWALYGFACAAPPLHASSDGATAVQTSDLRPRRLPVWGDAFYVAGASAFAALMQTIGWAVTNPERALLLRFATLACGLAVIGTSTEVALVRHVPRASRPPMARFRGALLSLALLVALVIVGVLVSRQG